MFDSFIKVIFQKATKIIKKIKVTKLQYFLKNNFSSFYINDIKSIQLIIILIIYILENQTKYIDFEYKSLFSSNSTNISTYIYQFYHHILFAMAYPIYIHCLNSKILY